jgi:hypothetical protein
MNWPSFFVGVSLTVFFGVLIPGLWLHAPWTLGALIPAMVAWLCFVEAL